MTRFFQDPQGWTQVPLKLGGTLGKPRFEIDARAAAEKAGQQLQQKLEKKLLEKIAPPAKDGQEKDQTEKPSLENTIRGLFGN